MPFLVNPKLKKIETFKNGQYISLFNLIIITVKKLLFETQDIIVDRKIVQIIRKGFYDNGQMEWREITLINDNNRKRLKDFWDRNGEKISRKGSYNSRRLLD